MDTTELATFTVDDKVGPREDACHDATKRGFDRVLGGGSGRFSGGVGLLEHGRWAKRCEPGDGRRQ